MTLYTPQNVVLDSFSEALQDMGACIDITTADKGKAMLEKEVYCPAKRKQIDDVDDQVKVTLPLCFGVERMLRYLHVVIERCVLIIILFPPFFSYFC